MQVKDTVIVITGGASGLGLATANHLYGLGAKVAVLDLQSAPTNDVLSVNCDVVDDKSVQQALATVKAQLGVPRVCVNCAGILGGGRVVGKEGPMALEAFKKVIDVDLVGTFNVMRLALADMMELEPVGYAEERGVIINIASIAATDGQIGQAAYSAAKAGVAGMTLPVAREMARWNIRVASIGPGVFATPMMEGASQKINEGLLAATVFPHRFGLPKELASCVEFIISNPMINGDMLRIDGAMRMPAK